MITLSAFADEISPDLSAAVKVLKEKGLGTLELRGVDGVNVMKFTPEHVKAAKAVLKREGMAVGSIATPIGKVEITDAFEPQAGQMARAVELAREFGSGFIRLFSFYMPKGEPPKKWRKDVLDRMEKLMGQVKGKDLCVVLENEEGLYGDTIERCVDIIASLKDPRLKMAWDPCNEIIVGERPYSDTYASARKHLGYLHVKDWNSEKKEMVPAGQGGAEWDRIMPALKGDKWEGIMALEPHLSAAGKFSGFTGPGLFGEAHAALVALLKQAGVEFR
jgi:sugar phosphate isomerase/epimerase